MLVEYPTTISFCLNNRGSKGLCLCINPRNSQEHAEQQLCSQQMCFLGKSGSHSRMGVGMGVGRWGDVCGCVEMWVCGCDCVCECVYGCVNVCGCMWMWVCGRHRVYHVKHAHVYMFFKGHPPLFSHHPLPLSVV